MGAKKMKIVNSNQLTPDFFENKEMEEIEIVRKILSDVKKYGNKAIQNYTSKFDRIKLSKLQLSKSEINQAYKKVDSETIATLKKAAKNISLFAKEQLKQLKNFEIKSNNSILGQKIIPLEKVGCYVPGGIYPLPSSALMSVIPAKIAGVKEIIVCSPRIQPATIVAADIAGADTIFNIGGVQAIGAMAYGTESVPKIDKIVGPGNKYVTAAKKEIYGLVGIDFIAGPSEVLIIADETGNPEFIAADLLAQAEHDPNARADLITTSRELAVKVNKQIKTQLSKLKTKDVAELAIRNGRIIIADNLEIAVEITNRKAPEHLELQVKNPEKIVSKLMNYGSLFIGENTAEVFGDYCSGTNHILPTNGASRYTGGLSVKDFVKIVTYQRFEGKIPKKMIKVASRLAGIEGLDAHRRAANLRLSNK